MDTPSRYLSTNTDKNNGKRYWRVIWESIPEMADTEDRERAIATFRQRELPSQRAKAADIPLWDGDAGRFTTLGAFGGAK